jgi:MFS family permease
VSTTERQQVSTASATTGWYPLTLAGVASRPLPRAYWRQWSASVISNVGDGINFVAMPLLALTLTNDPRLLALTTLAVFLPWLLIGLPAGVMVDRFNRQRLMVCANVIRVALFALVAVGAAAGWLGIPILVAMLLMIGCCEVLFDSSAQAFLPLIVAPAQLGRANSYLFAAEVVAGSIVGLAIGAFLFDAAPGLPFAANAASFAIAAAVIASIHVVRGRSNHDTTPARPDWALGVGLRFLWADRLLRTLAMMFTVTNLGLMFGQGVFVMYAIDELGLSSAEFGVLLAITAMGAATGGLIGHRVMSTIGVRASVVTPYLVFGAGNIVIGLATSVWVVAATGFVLGASITVWNVVTVTVRQRAIPVDRFGRVNAVYRWLGAAASAVGIAAGGFVANQWSVRTPFIVGGVVTVLAALLFARPVLAALDSSRTDQLAIVPPLPRTPAPPSIT